MRPHLPKCTCALHFSFSDQFLFLHRRSSTVICFELHCCPSFLAAASDHVTSACQICRHCKYLESAVELRRWRSNE
ncbi:hypothetical protein LINPERPRIM_LOCUS25216, partial [Linum perenne]